MRQQGGRWSLSFRSSIITRYEVIRYVGMVHITRVSFFLSC